MCKITNKIVKRRQTGRESFRRKPTNPFLTLQHLLQSPGARADVHKRSRDNFLFPSKVQVPGWILCHAAKKQASFFLKGWRKYRGGHSGGLDSYSVVRRASWKASPNELEEPQSSASQLRATFINLGSLELRCLRTERIINVFLPRYAMVGMYKPEPAGSKASEK